MAQLRFLATLYKESLMTVVTLLFGLAILVFVVLPVYQVTSLMRSDARAKKRWQALPSVDEYLAAHKGNRNRGICCWKCNSNQISESGVFDTGNIHYCRRCKTSLYRTG